MQKQDAIKINGQMLPVLKAALHTHSTSSDGYLTPVQQAKIYRDAGYDVLALSDHSQSNDVSKISVPGLTMISGIELHPWGPREILWHILALGVPGDFPGHYDTCQEALDAARSTGALVYCAHPRWTGVRTHEIMNLKGFDGIEVYNTGAQHIGKGDSMQIWDELLDAGFRPGHALAVDDSHDWTSFGQGWCMIAAEEHSQNAVLAALKAGNFYATQGPLFTCLECDNSCFHAEFTEAESVILISNRGNSICGRIPDWPVRQHCPAPLTSFDADLSRIPAGSYVRCQITDKHGRMAWSQPWFLD